MHKRCWGDGALLASHKNLLCTSAAFVLALSFGLVGTSECAKAEKVGVAAAVNPDAFSTLSGAPKTQLNIGKSIFYSERINTTTSGLVQVLLIDGSTFTVGPGSDLIIDRFVYNSKQGTGEITASFSKGVMRFVGGKISKNADAVTIKTPAGTLAIRGCIVQGNGKIWSFLYGDEMVWTGKDGRTLSVYQPGYTLDLTGGAAKVRPTTAADTQTLMAALSNSNTRAGISGESGNPPPKQMLAQTISLQQLIADATANRIDATLEQEETNQSVAGADEGDTPGPQPPSGPGLDPDPNPGPDPGPNPDPDPDPDPDPGPDPDPDPDPGPDPDPDPEEPPTLASVSGYAAGMAFGNENAPQFGLANSDTEGGAAFSLTNGLGVSSEEIRGGALPFPEGTVQVPPAESENIQNFCRACSFADWGSWHAERAVDRQGTSHSNMFGWWISGNVVSPDDMPTEGTAKYKGDAIGNVAKLSGDAWLSYVATGDMSMSWNFNNRNGVLHIDNFDGKNFNGNMSAPGLASFSGDLQGSGVFGNANGTFVKGTGFERGTLPPGVIGNFGVGNENWKATGIFGGAVAR